MHVGMHLNSYTYVNIIGSGKRFLTGDEDRVILYERGGMLNRYKPRPLSDGSDGPIKCIKWRGRFAAWTSKRGVVVHDVVQEKNISIIRLSSSQIEQAPAFDVCRLSWSDQKSLYVCHADTLRICRIRPRENQDLPQYVTLYFFIHSKDVSAID